MVHRRREVEEQAEVKVQEAQEQALQVEKRAIGLVQKNTALERRLQEMEKRARESESQTDAIEMEDSPSSNDTGELLHAWHGITDTAYTSHGRLLHPQYFLNV